MFNKNNQIILKISKLRSLSDFLSIPVTDYNCEFDDTMSDKDLDILESKIDKDISELTTKMDNKNVK